MIINMCAKILIINMCAKILDPTIGQTLNQLDKKLNIKLNKFEE